MEFKLFLNLFSILFVLLGLFFIYIAIKGWDKNYQPKKITAKIIRNLLGYNGTRIFTGILGVIFVYLFVSLLINMNTKVELPKSDKTELIKVTCGNNTVIYDINKINDLKDGVGPLFKKEDITELSLKDNRLSSIPNVVWSLNNLKVLDLENNNIKEIKISDILKLENLETIIITKTPISKENIEEIKNKTKIIIVS